MIEAVLVLLSASALIALSIRADTEFQPEARLPMQWELSGTVNWTAPRRLALAFTPMLAIAILTLCAVMMKISTPRPGQEGLEIPILLFMGAAFIALHLFHLWLIRRTIRQRDR